MTLHKMLIYVLITNSSTCVSIISAGFLNKRNSLSIPCWSLDLVRICKGVSPIKIMELMNKYTSEIHQGKSNKIKSH